MNKHRLFRKSKKIQGRGFFPAPALNHLMPLVLGGVKDKLEEILSKKKKYGAGLKFY